MGHLGFSYVGLVYILLLFVPNLIWAGKQPKGYSAKGENQALLWLERIGQVWVTCAALVFSDFNVHSWSIWSLWLMAFLLLGIYGRVLWMILGTIVLGTGHIGIHLQHLKDIK